MSKKSNELEKLVPYHYWKAAKKKERASAKKRLLEDDESLLEFGLRQCQMALMDEKCSVCKGMPRKVNDCEHCGVYCATCHLEKGNLECMDCGNNGRSEKSHFSREPAVLVAKWPSQRGVKRMKMFINPQSNFWYDHFLS